MVEGNSQVEELYYEALRRQAGPERASYLDTACGQDSDLRTRIESLLKADEEAGDFLESPAFEGEATLGRSLVTEGPGSMIGPYKLLERIGEGGMAVVYMAEPAPSTRSALFGPASTGVLSDSEGTIRRKVALKIIKLGMDTHQVIARFEAERQALALMDHPSIAKVLDAGATETGRPYFVMELVQGASITECCDRNSLSTKDRLALFVQV
ncbi:MAG TPA: protein kinase, partial [Sedimentisphaerales bacterium]|nr:protein kinase [Sedimentisphaerales bacterium]